MNIDFSDFDEDCFFDQFTTKRLLIFLKESRKSGRYWFDDFGSYTITTSRIKNALSNREHVLTKSNKKKIRQQKAKEKKHR